MLGMAQARWYKYRGTQIGETQGVAQAPYSPANRPVERNILFPLSSPTCYYTEKGSEMA